MAANLGTAWIQVKPSMNGVRGNILSGLKGTGAQVGDQMGSEVGKSKGMTVGMAAVWGAASAVALKAIDTISTRVTQSIDGAIKRIDTLNNSARTFANMGFDARDSAKAMKALEKSIKGLPTPLDSAVRGMTGLAATYGDVGKGQKVFSALNNAILGFGGSADMVDNAITQLSQLPMDGPLDAQTWNSLRNSGITPVLVAMAKDSGMSVSQMKKAFGDGELTVQDFTDKLIKMNEQGGGGLKSLETIAQDSTKGISTSIANSNTAVVRGVASIIKAIGPEGIAGVITNAGANMEKGLSAVATGISWIKDNSNLAIPAVTGLSAALMSTFIPALVASLPPMKLWSTHLGLMGLQMAKFAKFAIIPTIIGAIVGALALMAMNPEAVTSIFQKISGAIQGFVEKIPSIVSSISTFVTTQIPAIFQSLLSGIQQIAPLVIPAITSLFNTIFDFLSQNGPSIMETFTKFITDGANSLAQNIEKYAAIGADIVASLINSITKALPGFIDSGVKIITSIIGAVTKALPKIIQTGADIITKLVDAITANLPTIIAAAVMLITVLLNGLIQALPTLLSAAITIITALANALITNLPTIINAAIELIMALVTGIIENLPLIIEAAVQLIVALVNGLIGALPQLIQAALQLILSLATALIANLPLIIAAAIQLIVALVNGLIGAIPQLVVAAGKLIIGIVGALGSLAWKLLQAGGELIGKLFNGIVGGVGKIGQGIGQIASKIWDTIKNINLLEAGKDIIKGLWNGISNMAGWIGEKIKGFGEGVLGGIKDFFGIKSPSRVMRDQVGKMLGEGIGIGITKSTRTAVHAAEASSDAILGAFGTNAGINAGLVSNASLGAGTAQTAQLTADAAQASDQRPPVRIGQITIASDYDADRLLKIMGVKQGLYAKGVVS